MLENLKKFFEFSAKTGIFMPAAYDRVSRGPSIALLLTHLSSYIAMGSIIYLITQDALQGTVASIIYATIMITFYLIRRLTGAKFDLDDKSFTLENNSETTIPQKDKK